MNIVAIDFETANGSSKLSACEIGYSVFKETGEKILTRSHYLVPPNEASEFTAMTIAIHGIKQIKTINAPTFKTVFEKTLCNLMDGSIVLAHNADFDGKVLSELCKHYGIKLPENIVFACTMRMSKKLIESTAYSLDIISKRYGLTLDHHRAGSDSEVCGQVFFKMLEEYGSGMSPLEFIEHLEMKYASAEFFDKSREAGIKKVKEEVKKERKTRKKSGPTEEEQPRLF